MRRIDRYWKRCGACLLAAVTLMLGQGTMQSYAMNAQVINSPDRIVVQDENKNTGNQNNTNTQTVTTKARFADLEKYPLLLQTLPLILEKEG